MELLHLFTRRWFTRYWVVQEVALGSHPVVVCGRTSVKWDALVRIADWICKRASGFVVMFKMAGGIEIEGCPTVVPPGASNVGRMAAATSRTIG